MPFAFERLYRRLGSRYFLAYAAFDVTSALMICLATVGLFSLYTEMSTTEFWQVASFAEACVMAALAYVLVKARRELAPVKAWIQDGRDPDTAVAAWRAAVALPRRFVIANGWQPFAIIALPVSVFFTVRLDLPWYSAGIVFAGAIVAVAYSAILHFFASEMFMRPVVEDLSRSLPRQFRAPRLGVPLRWKLLGALPIINVVTGVVVSGLSTDGKASLEELGVDVVVAVLVAFTVSFELTLLVTKSLLRPIDDLLEATERVKRGDLQVQVPLVSGDEMGELAGSFNDMMRGLSEREALREAFGSYVDPDVARRVLEEGELLEGQDREVTVMFVDVRDFTPLAERSSARETVAFLNDFFDTVVPVVRRHGGHANKFLGDGVLAVFGAPERHPDHADRALAAAGDIVAALERRFGSEVRVGIGLNSGPVVVGSVGGGGRLEFTVIGDAVNVGARVEAATRETGDTVLLTEATRCLLDGSQNGHLEVRGELPLKGKSEPVGLYAADGRLDERSTSARSPLIAEA